MNKYRNIKTVVDGIKFDSKKEAKRYENLKLLQSAGIISGLKMQVRFPIRIGGILICTYIADFEYMENGKQVVEDVKGFLTPEYKLKRKLMQAVHEITIIES